MTNYRSALVLAALIGGAACADDQTSPASKAVAPKPAAAATPAPATPAAGTATAGSATRAHYVQAAGSTLGFTFEQAGAQGNGRFKQFTTTFDYDAGNPGASRLDVKVPIASLDTQDKDRDSTLASSDLFAAQKFPYATYTASSLAKTANGLEAVGKLTIRDVTRDLRIPLTIRPAGAGLELSGTVTINRLDYGVGQGEWQATDSVGNPVKLSYKVLLNKAGG